jgi:hypothetical protein
MRFFILVCMFCFIIPYGRAQITEPGGFDQHLIVVPDTVDTPHFSSLSFERLLSSYQWSLAHRTNYVNRHWFLTVDEQFRSSLIQTDRKFIKDQQELTLLAGRRITDRVDVRVSGSSLFLSDNQITGLNDAAISRAYAGIGFRPFMNITFAPYLGYTIDRQAERIDRGLSYRAHVRGTNIEYAETFLNIDGQFSLQHVDPRTTANHFIHIDVDHEFAAQTFMNVQSYYMYSRREFYFPADDVTEDLFNVTMNIDQRFDRRIGTAGEIQYALRNNLIGVISTSIDWRTVTRGFYYQPTLPFTSYLFDTSVDELSLNIRLGFRYTFGDRFSGTGYLTYSERSEEHRLVSVDTGIPATFVENRAASEFIKNNFSKRTVLTSQGNLRLARRHYLMFAGSSSILRYDTPSLQNFDDRDELRLLLFTGTRHDLTRYLTLNFSVDLIMAHIVYLRAQRSANNNWNRVLRFTPAITYNPIDWFQTTNAFEVLANYTVYDFEDILTDVRSLSYRQMGWIDSTRVQVTENTRLDFFSHYRRYERGELRWGPFSERPLHSFEELTVIATVRYDIPHRSIAFAGGIRYFNRDRYRYNLRERELETQVRNIGPTCYIYWNIDNRLLLTLQGWYEMQFRDSVYYSSIPNLSIDIGARF